MTRIDFFRPLDEAETAEYLRLTKRIAAFWRVFATKAARSGQMLSELRTELGQLEPGLGLELRHEGDGTKTLHVLPIDGVELLPLCEAIVDGAPTLPPWNFATRRGALGLEQALAIVLKDVGVDLSRARARVGIGRGHSVEIVLASEHFGSASDERALHAAGRLIEALLGDEVFDTWVSAVSVSAARRSGPLRLVNDQTSSLPLTIEQLVPSVEAAIAGVRSALPDRPCHEHCERAEWTMFELGDDASEPDPGAEPTQNEATQDEVTLPDSGVSLAATMCPEMLRTHLTGASFDSERFSRFSEKFCVLQLQIDGDSLDDRVSRRIQLEELLDRSLVPGRLGCVVGFGVAQRHMYVYLALTNLQPAIELACRRARELQVGRDSRLTFCDSRWAREWIGVWDGA